MNKQEAIAELTRKKKVLSQEAFVNSIKNNVPHLIEEYISAGCDLNAPDKNGITPLSAAISTDDSKIIKQLIEKGAKADDADYFFDAIYNAPFIDSVEIIDLLVSEGCPVDFIEEATGFDALALAKDMGSSLVINRVKEILNA